MPSYRYRSSRRFKPSRVIQGPNERIRYPFYTTPWGDETPSSPQLFIYDSNGVDVTSTYSSDTYLVAADAETEVVGADVIWPRYVTGLIPGQTYKMAVRFTLGGSEQEAYMTINCQEYGSPLTKIKEMIWLGTTEKIRYQLDTRPWRFTDEMNTSLSLTTTVTSPVVTLFDLNNADVTSTYTTDDSGTAPTEVSDYWVRSLFFDNIIVGEFRPKFQFVLQNNTYEAWGQMFGEQ